MVVEPTDRNGLSSAWRLMVDKAVATHAGPMSKLVATRKFELLKNVCHVVFHCIRAHALKSRDFRIGESVPHSFSDAPFRRRQEVVITGPTAETFCCH